METKPLLYGLIGFFLGGLLVAVAASLQDTSPPTRSDTMTMSQMTHSLKTLKGDDFDKAFIAGMIEHHQSAVDMAKLSSGQAKHDEVKQLSMEIIEAQQNEIGKMKQWQQAWGYDQSNDGHSMDSMHDAH